MSTMWFARRGGWPHCGTGRTAGTFRRATASSTRAERRPHVPGGHRLARALRRSGLACAGVNMVLADGEAAFQEVFHVRQGIRAVVASRADDLRRRHSHA